MNTYYIIGGIVILILIVFTGLMVLDNPANTAEDIIVEEVTEDVLATGDDTSIMVPAPGNEGDVDEMIVSDEEATREEDGAASTAPRFVITYDGSSFSPPSITIKKGQTVTWVNEGSRSMWVASAMHPTHTVYPEKSGNDCLGSSFDACRGVLSGGSWSFTFDSTGEWGYHNHLRASNFGKVIVE